MTRRAAAVSFGQSAQTIADRSRFLGQVPESVLDRDQYIYNQVHFSYAFGLAYKLHQVAFDVSQEPFVGLCVHVIFLSGPRIALDQGARDCFAEREYRRLQDGLNDLIRIG
jgi:hypothetical protein